MRTIIRTTTVLAANGMLAVALLAGCDGNERAEATQPTANQRLQAEGLERSAHLQGQARTHDSGPPEAGNFVVAEQVDHAAKLDGHARTHGNAVANDDAPAPYHARTVEEFVPGSRHMPTR